MANGTAGGTGRLIVAKVGSSTLTDASGAPDRAFIASLCDQAARLVARGDRVVIVSSGAVAAGMERLRLPERPIELPVIQACSAAGQAALTEVYAEALEAHGIPCGQVLLTRGDVLGRTSYLNIRNTFDALLDLGVVPVVNENDTVSPTEVTFGENDMLGAIVSTLVGADLYVILSDVDGLHEADPSRVPGSPLVGRVSRVDGDVLAMAGRTASRVGTGGMASKVRAGRAMLSAGIPMVICAGREPDVLVRVASGEPVGTRFEAEGDVHEAPRKLWIGIAGMSRGSVVVDRGAERVLLEDGASLLPVGVREVEGDFSEGDVVSVLNADGDLIARGLSRYDADDLRRCAGLRLDVIGRFMPDKADQPAIHRDELLVF